MSTKPSKPSIYTKKENVKKKNSTTIFKFHTSCSSRPHSFRSYGSSRCSLLPSRKRIILPQVTFSDIKSLIKDTHKKYFINYLKSRPTIVFPRKLDSRLNVYFDQFLFQSKKSIRDATYTVPPSPPLLTMGAPVEDRVIKELSNVSNKNIVKYLEKIKGVSISKILHNTIFPDAPLTDAIGLVLDRFGKHDTFSSLRIEIKITFDCSYTSARAPCNPKALQILHNYKNIIVILAHCKGSLESLNFEFTGKLLVCDPFVNKCTPTKKFDKGREIYEFVGVPFDVHGYKFF